jgi:hypothetical protein
MLRRWLKLGSGRITRREADLLLDGEPGPARGRHAGLSDLLAAAAAPGRPDELAGERAAVAGFMREWRPPTGPASDVPAGSRSTRGARSRRRRAGIVAAASATVLAVGGTAYAASTGRLPDVVQRVVDGVFTGDGTPSGSPTDTGRPGGPAGAGPNPAGQVPGSTPGVTGPGGAPGVSEGRLNGLCRSWEANRGNPHSNAISAEDLRILAAAAGGEDRIEAFCAARQNPTADPTDPGRPGNPDPGGGRPTAPPGGGPTKKGKTK